MKPAYCLFDNVQITDPAKLEAYKEKVFPMVDKFGGKYVVAGGQLRKIEGDWSPHYLVIPRKIGWKSHCAPNRRNIDSLYRHLQSSPQRGGHIDFNFNRELLYL